MKNDLITNETGGAGEMNVEQSRAALRDEAAAASMGGPLKLSILMPVYNEQYTLKKSVDRVLQAPLPEGMSREVILVDDGSDDNSANLIAELVSQHPAIVKAFYHEKNQGKGAAVRTAIEAASGDIIIFQDADLEYDPNEYERMIAPILGGYADVTYGSRFAPRDERRVLFYKHSLGNQFLTTLSNWCTDLNLTDMETCYKAFNAGILKSIPIRSNRFGIEPEITAKIAHRDLRVYEIPINYHGRGYRDGKKIRWYHGAAAIYTILKYTFIQDCYGGRYGEENLSRLTGVNNFVKWMVEVIQPYFGSRLLEIGSGVGNVTHELPHRELVVVSDSDEQYLHTLREQVNFRDECKVVKLDITQPEDFKPLEQERLDTIICLNVLERIEDDQTTLDCFHKTLAPGGRAIVLVPQHQSLYGEFDRQLGHRRRYSKKLLRERMEKAGFEIEKTMNFDSASILGWFVSGKILRRRRFGRLQLKLFNTIIPVIKHLERWLPLPGQYVIMIGRKTGEHPRE